MMSKRPSLRRAGELFEKFKARDHAELVQARKALSDHMFGQVAAGETDEHKLAVAGLTHLNRWREGGRV